ncbi:sulfatase-like hydrolase/transferase [Bremerella alba]|uniref:Sulfatase N-terminal domain-containing protein n=1 Tax=Bremerella alba TaxID=980252 RepID=A0A7V9A753_9BACT|nr:sulfatase-like hydrolase/transferase [Bremerella alba]MBA2115070.1 hypothetical protein [Bremerella alba]
MRTLLLSFVLVLLASSHLVADTTRPNILILLGDDIDRDSLGPWGGQAHTPHLDQLAKDGMRLDSVYANVAMCAPFRQELYSGRTAWRTRAMPNHSRSAGGTKSLPHYLQPLGYRVGLLGKKHIGPANAYPFDNLGDVTKKNDGNPELVKRAKAYMTEARDAGKPFCLVVASHDGHGPYTTGDPSQYDANALKLETDKIDTPAYRQALRLHLAEVTNLDALLGKLRGVLAEEKLAGNTLVLFCSEQGNAFPFAKWTCFNDGLASGVIVALPGTIPVGKSNKQLTWIADIAPTLLEATGGEASLEDFDGKSQWQNWTGGNLPIHRYAYGAFTNCNIIDNRDRIFPIRCIRDDRYTLIWSPRHEEEITSNTTLTQALAWIEADPTDGKASPAATWVRKAKRTKPEKDDQLVHRLHHRPEWALYDRTTDPEELTNLIDDPHHAKDAERLKQELQTWLSKWDDADPVVTERGFVNQN